MEDYQKHVTDTFNSVKSRKQVSYCGENIEFEWAFTDVDHAIFNTLKEGRLQVCPKCAQKIIEILKDQ